MPPAGKPIKRKSLDELVHDLGAYAPQAFGFVQEGLNFAATQIHGDDKKGHPDKTRHITGQQLCEGLREFAHRRWGRLAGTVLRRWGICETLDFGRIVFALIEGGWLRKTDEDSLDDFRNVFDFDKEFETGYQIVSKA